LRKRIAKAARRQIQPTDTFEQREIHMSDNKAKNVESEQLLHLVFGGELETLSGITFRDLKNIDIVGIYPNYATAERAWKAKAQATVDNAHMRYFIVHLHRLLDPA
jgi:hypothetical protein